MPDASQYSTTFNLVGSFTRGFDEETRNEYYGLFEGLNGKCTSNGTCTLDFLQQLYDRGIIPTRAFSIYLGPPQLRKRYWWPLNRRSRPRQIIQRPHYPLHDRSFFTYRSLHRELHFDLHHHRWEYNKLWIPAYQSAVLDTGAPLWPVPEAVWFFLSDNYFSIPKSVSEERNGFPPYNVTCEALAAEGELTIGFLEGKEISLPIKDLVVRNVTLMANCGEVCGAVDVYNAWGVLFMSIVYTTFNVENLTVALSNVVWTDEERVEGLSG